MFTVDINLKVTASFHIDHVLTTLFRSEEAKAADLFVLGANGREHVAFGAGDMHFKDMNGDHQITEADRTFIGDPNPDIFGNIFTSLAYKRIRLDLNFNYSLGNDVYNYMRSQLEGGSRFLNQTTAMTKRWQTEGQQMVARLFQSLPRLMNISPLVRLTV